MSTQVSEKKAKKASTKTKNIDEPVQAEPAVVAQEAPKAEEKEKKGKKEKKEKKEKKLPSPKEVDAPAESAPASEESLPEAEGSDERLSRKKKSYVQLVNEVDQLNDLVERYVSEHRDAKNTDLNRFLKGLEKGLRKVRVHIQKIGKNRTANAGNSGVQSGFQKPVRISDAVAQFTGWSSEEPRARVEVTNFVCDYIKQHNLQSPEDRRVILADQRLSQLLDYQQERDGNLTYATIQKLLAKHYTAIATQ